MTLLDWRSLDSSRLVPLYAREHDRWQRELGWDTSQTWLTVEAARVGWGLPGVACVTPAGEIAGWAFYFEREDEIDIGAFVSDSDTTTASILDELVHRASPHRGLAGFVHASAPGLAAGLASRACAVRPYAYQVRATSAVGATREVPLPSFSPWTSQLLEETAALLREAYGGAGRLFARDDSIAAWRQYVRGLVEHDGCGVLQPALSRVVRTADGLTGVALVTRIGDGMAHLAQLAVSPAVRRTGMARALLAAVLDAAHAAGLERMSLLVAEDNAGARALYERAGFASVARFIAFGRPASTV